VKAKTITKEQVKKRLQCYDHKERKEITLEFLKGVLEEQLTPALQKLQQSAKPAVMGNLSVIDDNLMS